ncbi:MAG: preprotein translocase subunit SecE [Patescibacteria group bacterium]
MFERINIFLQESRQELKRVNWPTRAETVRYTLFVVGFSIGIAVLLGIIDFAFLKGLDRLVV